VQNVAWRFQSISSRPSRTFCANASAALVFRPEVQTPVATGCLFAVSLYHLPREQNGASTRRPTSTIWVILPVRWCAGDVSSAIKGQAIIERGRGRPTGSLRQPVVSHGMLEHFDCTIGRIEYRLGRPVA
jgi:hypothetical protein